MSRFDSIRPARPDDLPEVYEILRDAERDEGYQPPQLAAPPAFLRHELETGTILVAESSGRLVGFTVFLRRGPVGYLAELFVRRERQSAGLGKDLLESVVPRHPRQSASWFTVASRDHRALALYVRAGLTPRYPVLELRGERLSPPDVPSAARDGVVASPADPSDPDLLDWDAEISGRRRPQDVRFWLEEGRAQCLWLERGGRRIGYGLVRLRSPESLWNQGAIAVGPVGVLDPTDASEGVLAVVEHARSRGGVIRVDVPGPHPALPTLLEIGMRIVYVTTYLSRGAEDPVDPRRYLPSGEALF